LEESDAAGSDLEDLGKVFVVWKGTYWGMLIYVEHEKYEAENRLVFLRAKAGGGKNSKEHSGGGSHFVLKNSGGIVAMNSATLPNGQRADSSANTNSPTDLYLGIESQFALSANVTTPGPSTLGLIDLDTFLQGLGYEDYSSVSSGDSSNTQTNANANSANSTQNGTTSGLIPHRPFVALLDMSIENPDVDGLLLELPFREGFIYDCVIDWGDGTKKVHYQRNGTANNIGNAPPSVDVGVSPPVVHEFPSPGKYNVTISGVMEALSARTLGTTSNQNWKAALKQIYQLGDMKWTSLESMFEGSYNLKSVAGGDSPMSPNGNKFPGLSTVKTTKNMFRALKTLTSIPDSGGWDLSSLVDMTYMFSSMPNVNPDTTNWDLSSLIDMSFAFHDAISASPDTRFWDLSSVEKMEGTFFGATAAEPQTGNWTLGSVTTMRKLFARATAAKPDTERWDVSKVSWRLI
jgi:hypothetical protein